jgi:hypothetical protein
MVALAILTSFLLFAASTILLVRLREAERATVPGTALGAMVAQALDERLLPDGRRGGLADVALPFREAHDEPCDPATLLAHVERAWRDPSAADPEALVKRLYQLQALLHLPDNALAELLTPVLRHLTATTTMGRPIAHAATIARGALVDTATMQPLNMGSRVEQPLGVVLYDAEGRVLRRAKVWCG